MSLKLKNQRVTLGITFAGCSSRYWGPKVSVFSYGDDPDNELRLLLGSLLLQLVSNIKHAQPFLHTFEGS